jgi:hypothetical protein
MQDEERREEEELVVVLVVVEEEQQQDDEWLHTEPSNRIGRTAWPGQGTRTQGTAQR